MSVTVHVHGAGGRMGRACVAAVREAPDLELAGTTGRGDDLAAALAARSPEVLVEFTVGTALPGHVGTALEAGCHVVSGTTGADRARVEELGERARRAGRGFVLAPNFALGVLLMQRFAAEAARWFGAAEIVEYHHDRKRDAPSGTALATADRIGRQARPEGERATPERELVAGSRGGERAGTRIHSVRLPGLLAHQEVLFGGPGELLTLRHDTLDRQAFMPGVLLAVRRVVGRTGLVDSLEALLDGPGARPG